MLRPTNELHILRVTQTMSYTYNTKVRLQMYLILERRHLLQNLKNPVSFIGKFFSGFLLAFHLLFRKL